MVEHLIATFLAVLGAMDQQAPKVGHARELAAVSAAVVVRWEPPEGWSRELAVSVLAEMAWRESRLDPAAVGSASCKNEDCHAYGAWQIEHHPELLGHSYAQAAYAYDLVRRSAKMCPEHPLAMFTSGRCSIHKLADDRMTEAQVSLDISQLPLVYAEH